MGYIESHKYNNNTEFLRQKDFFPGVPDSTASIIYFLVDELCF